MVGVSNMENFIFIFLPIFLGVLMAWYFTLDKASKLCNNILDRTDKMLRILKSVKKDIKKRTNKNRKA